MRRLATIQRISAIRPIEGADKIEVADVLGWSVVVGKGEFQAGDLAVYFEIDSWLDASNPAFASFEDRFTNWGTKRGMRLKTIRLRKQISQGLLMPIQKFPALATVQCQPSGAEGLDVTELLGIEKWEAPEESAGNNGGGGKAMPFPHFIHKTDQERVQNIGGKLAEHADDTFEVTIKLDGSSMTVYHLNKSSGYFEDWADKAAKRDKPKTLWQKLLSVIGLGKPSVQFVQGVCSRNMEVEKDGNTNFARYAREHNIFEALENLDMNIALQGELIGPAIQGNYEKVEGYEFHVFTVFDIDKQQDMLPEEARAIVDVLGLRYVPVLEKEFQFSCFPSVRDLVEALLAMAEGPGMRPGVKREGLVFKSNTDPFFSFKAISQSYLLKKG